MTEYISQLVITALRNMSISDTEISSGSFGIEHPDDLSHGDYATNVALVYAKALGLKPRDLAEKIAVEIKSQLKSQVELSEKIQNKKNVQLNPAAQIEKVTLASPGFINFHLAPTFFAGETAHILAEKEKFGSSTVGAGKKVLVEYSSPNIAKPFTVGHLRSTVIGDAIANILAFSGYTIIRDNHLGDWGTQFGKQIVALEKWGVIAELDKPGDVEWKMRYLVDLYVKFHDMVEVDKSLEDEARAKFSALEKGDKAAQELYKKILAVSMEYFKGIYARLNVSAFTTEHGEHFYESYIPNVLADLKKANLLQESEGAQLIFFPDEKFPPFMIQKKDGSTLYATRDLATDKWRRDTYGPDITIVNEVGIEQSLHFKQLFEVEEMLGYFKKNQRVHVAHGFYRFPDGKMSTRKGNVIWLEDIINEAVKRAGEINPATAEVVGVGSIKFNDLKRESSQDIIFSWDDMLNLKGDSCPYLQYSYARSRSILAKAKEAGVSASSEFVPHDISPLEKLMYRFPEIVFRAGKEYQPHYIATYLIELAGAFSSFYANTQIVKANEPLSPYYVALTEAYATVVKNGLSLLGIAVPEKM